MTPVRRLLPYIRRYRREYVLGFASLVLCSTLFAVSPRVLQYAVDVLQVRDVLVVGHYGCGGVRAACTQMSLGLIDNWLRHIQDVRDRHASLLPADDDLATTIDRVCELNVIEQVRNVSLTTIVRDAWQRGHELAVHGWIYGVGDGLLHDLGCTISATAEVADVHARAVGLVAARVQATR